MKFNREISSLVLLIVYFFTCCTSKQTKTKSNTPVQIERSQKLDTISNESQTVNFSKEKKEAFIGSQAARVVNYSFLDTHDYQDDSLSKGQLLKIMPNYNKPKITLTKEQTSKLFTIINDHENYKFGGAFCYYPRNCFCFYNSGNEIIGFYEICFECGRIQSIPQFGISKKGGLSDNGLKALKQFCASVGVTIR